VKGRASYLILRRRVEALEARLAKVEAACLIDVDTIQIRPFLVVPRSDPTRAPSDGEAA
jgi:hypothetical protein